MALTRPSTLARVSSQPLLVLLLPLLVPNIFFPFDRRVGVLFFTPGREAGTKRPTEAVKGETKRSEGWQGAKCRHRACQTGLVFVWRELCLGPSARASRRP